jgi:aminoglycoside 6'-N-acetyltransferase
MQAAGVSFRPLTRADFPTVVGWLAEPHVAEWWDPLSLEGVERDFGPCVDGHDPTQVFVCLDDDVPVGLVQIYRMADNPDEAVALGIDDAAGIDLLIGDVARCGLGLGPRIIAGAAELIWDLLPKVGGALACPSVHNVRSQRAFEKAGFGALHPISVPGDKDDEVLYFRPRPTGA